MEWIAAPAYTVKRFQLSRQPDSQYPLQEENWVLSFIGINYKVLLTSRLNNNNVY